MDNEWNYFVIDDVSPIPFDDGYPYIQDLPDLQAYFNPPYPSVYANGFVQDENEYGGYPYIEGLSPLVPTISSPLPIFFFLRDDAEYGGYPYVEVPNMVDYWEQPLPFLFYKPNKAKKIEYKIVIPSYNQKIEIQNCSYIIKGKLQKRRGDVK